MAGSDERSRARLHRSRPRARSRAASQRVSRPSHGRSRPARHGLRVSRRRLAAEGARGARSAPGRRSREGGERGKRPRFEDTRGRAAAFALTSLYRGARVGRRGWALGFGLVGIALAIAPNASAQPRDDQTPSGASSPTAPGQPGTAEVAADPTTAIAPAPSAANGTTPKRELPDYDGRGAPPTTTGDVLL